MTDSTSPAADAAPAPVARKPRAARKPVAKPVAPPEGTRSYTVLTRQTATRRITVYAESESAARRMADDAGGAFDTVERTTVYAWRTPGK
jgi:hypothetical protein